MIMSKITISNLQTDENLLVDLHAIDAHSVVGGSKKESEHGGDDRDDKYGYGGDDDRDGKYGGGDDRDNKYGHGYCPPVYCPPCH
jgi:hypothetical protein